MGKELIPALRFRGFEGEWGTDTFSDVFTLLQNNTLPRVALNVESGLASDVHYGDVLIKFGEVLDVQNECLPYITNKEDVQKTIQSALKDGDIVFADTAEDYTAGKSSEIQGVGGETVLSGLHTIPCRPKIEFAPFFSGYYTNSESFRRQLYPLMQGIKVISISKTFLKSVNFSFPQDWNEQKFLGKFFHKISNLILDLEQRHAKLLNFKKSMLQKMFPQNGSDVPEVRFDGFQGKWKQDKINILANASKGSGYSKNDLITEGTPIILYGSLYTSYRLTITEVNTFVEQKKGSIISAGNEVIIPTSGETAEEIARASAILSPNIIIGGDLIVLKPDKSIDPVFLALSISNGTVQKELVKKAQGKTIVHIHCSDVTELNIPFPSIEEQKLIANFYITLDSDLSFLQKRIAKLQTLKKSFLERMFV